VTDFVPFDGARYLTDRAAFRREQLVLPNGRLYGECEELWQRDHVWAPWDSGRYRVMYLEMSRGMAKTTKAAMGVLEWALFEEQSEIALFAGDEDQAGIALKIMGGMIRANPYLKSAFDIQRDRILVPSTGTTCNVYAADAATAFGIGGSARSLLIICDELWVWENEQLWEAVVSSTGKVGDNWRLVAISNAGIEGYSKIAWRLREQAIAGVDESIYFWRSPGCIAGWVTEAWKNLQRRVLTPSGYRRLIENEWTASSESAVDPADWDALVSEDVAPYPKTVPGEVVVGLDASKSAKKGSDTTAAVAVVRDGDTYRLVAHRIWSPVGSDGDIDLRRTVLPWLLDLAGRYGAVRVLYDPYNLSTAAQIAREAGLSFEELPQTPARQTEFTTAFLDVVRSRSLRTYRAPDLREHVLNASMVNTPRGVRLAKEKSSKKIDGAVALAMAVGSAATTDIGVPRIRWLDGPVSDFDERLWHPLGVG